MIAHAEALLVESSPSCTRRTRAGFSAGEVASIDDSSPTLASESAISAKARGGSGARSHERLEVELQLRQAGAGGAHAVASSSEGAARGLSIAPRATRHLRGARRRDRARRSWGRPRPPRARRARRGAPRASRSASPARDPEPRAGRAALSRWTSVILHRRSTRPWARSDFRGNTSSASRERGPPSRAKSPGTPSRRRAEAAGELQAFVHRNLGASDVGLGPVALDVQPVDARARVRDPGRLRELGLLGLGIHALEPRAWRQDRARPARTPASSRERLATRDRAFRRVFPARSCRRARKLRPPVSRAMPATRRAFAALSSSSRASSACATRSPRQRNAVALTSAHVEGHIGASRRFAPAQRGAVELTGDGDDLELTRVEPRLRDQAGTLGVRDGAIGRFADLVEPESLEVQASECAEPSGALDRPRSEARSAPRRLRRGPPACRLTPCAAPRASSESFRPSTTSDRPSWRSGERPSEAPAREAARSTRRARARANRARRKLAAIRRHSPATSRLELSAPSRTRSATGPGGSDSLVTSSSLFACTTASLRPPGARARPAAHR